MEDVQRLDVPVVKRAVVLEFQGADGMRDAFQRVALAVGVVVGGIDAPLVARAVVRGAEDAVHDWVAHVEVGRGHVDLGPQGPRAVGEFAGLHAAEEVEVFFDGAIAVGAVAARRGERAAVLADLVGREVTDVGLSGQDHLLGPIVELVEIVGGVEQAVFPIEAQPADVLHDRVDVFDFLLRGVGVVEAEVAQPPVVPRDAEVQADRLGMADVKVAVRLRRKAGVDAVVAAAGQVGVDVFAEEVGGSRGGIGCAHGRVRSEVNVQPRMEHGWNTERSRLAIQTSDETAISFPVPFVFHPWLQYF